MASLIWDKNNYIDYRMDGTIDKIVFDGFTLLDLSNGVAVENWEKRLAMIVVANGLNVERETLCHAFVYQLAEDGHFEILKTN